MERSGEGEEKERGKEGEKEREIEGEKGEGKGGEKAKRGDHTVHVQAAHYARMTGKVLLFMIWC